MEQVSRVIKSNQCIGMSTEITALVSNISYIYIFIWQLARFYKFIHCLLAICQVQNAKSEYVQTPFTKLAPLGQLQLFENIEVAHVQALQFTNTLIDQQQLGQQLAQNGYLKCAPKPSYNQSFDKKHTVFTQFIAIIKTLHNLMDSEHSSEQNLINELKNQIEDKYLIIFMNQDLENIEFLNDFDIEVLQINFCTKIIPKLNNSKIKKIILDNCGIHCLNELQLPNLEALTLQEESNLEDGNELLQSLGQFKKLKELMFDGYENLELNLIPQLQLTELCLYECKLQKIDILTQFILLTNLNLFNNPNIDVKPLSQMVQLISLNLGRCSLKNLDFLKPLENLKELYLSNNQNIDINSLQYLVNLKELDLSFNSYINIHSLQYLKSLTSLKLFECSIIDLTILKHLINLKELQISKNNIVYLEPLLELSQIEHLTARFNKVLDVSVLKNHPNFSSYELDYQDQPTLKEIMFANKLRDINAQVTSLRNIREYHSNVKSKKVLQNKKIDNSLQQIFNTQTQFIQQVASLFQKQSSLEGYQ
ncbi:leucine-rich_repeat domain-containing protein [Hexamita inflata]|uniref:Leucine-rich repeat domain-containing protein n=1 Tax=Hexamita inflata TaxID=28002 RepID=A0AA86UM15_9EUKA|nr:leucine-rich repeat domain-containing protein [Hexamita inflata]